MQGGWTTADYALIVSLCSASLSLAGFVWNVWSKFIFPKARVSVSFDFCAVESGLGIHFFRRPSVPSKRDPATRLRNGAMHLRVVNQGPGDLLFISAAFSSGGYFHTRKNGIHMIASYSRYPFELDHGTFRVEEMSKSIPPSGSIDLYFPITAEILERVGPYRVGFVDSFDRVHWCSRKDVRHFVQANADFNQTGQ